MEALSHSDILALNRVISDIYTVRDLESYYRTVFTSIQSIIPYELSSFNNALTGTTRFLNIISASQDHSSVSQKLLSVLNAHLHEHPF
jgi:hypothetical protein